MKLPFRDVSLSTVAQKTYNKNLSEVKLRTIYNSLVGQAMHESARCSLLTIDLVEKESMGSTWKRRKTLTYTVYRSERK